MNNWLEGLDVGEEVLDGIGASIPTQSSYDHRHAATITSSLFRDAPEAYKAKAEKQDGQINQLVWELQNANNGKEMKRPLAFNCGAGFDLDNNDGGKTAERVRQSSTWDKFSGGSQIGKLITSLMQKFGVNKDNVDACTMENKEDGSAMVVSPEYQRFTRWWIQMLKEKGEKPALPDFKYAPMWDGVVVQLDGEERPPNDKGKVYYDTVVVGIAKLPGESEANWQWYLNRLAELGTPLPYYALGPNDDPLEFDYSGRDVPANPPAATETKAATNGTSTKPATTTKTETKATESKPAETKPAETKAAETAPAGGGSDELLGLLLELAANNDDQTKFKQAANPLMAKYKMAKLIPWVSKPETFNGLKAGEISELPK